MVTQQADKLLFFVDSSQLYGRPYSSLFDNLRSLMYRLKSNDKLPKNAEVYVVFNKIDLKPAQYQDKCEHEENIVQMIQDTFGGQNLNQVKLNSKSLDGNSVLVEFFIEILQPIVKTKIELDWVNNDI